jgi:hypothetical protein
VEGPRKAKKTSQDSQSQGKIGNQDSGIWSKSAVDSTAPLVRAFHGQTVIMIRMEKENERVQGKDKGNFGVSLQLK